VRKALSTITSVTVVLAALSMAAYASPVAVTLHHCFNGDLDQADIQEIVRRFETANPDIKVEIEMFDFGAYFGEKLAVMGASGTLGDVFVLNDSLAIPYHASGLSLNLDPLMARDGMDRKDFWTAQLPAMTWQGELRGLPFDFSTFGWFYNTEMFAQSGLATPAENWTWDDALATGKKLTQTDSSGSKYQWGVGRARLWDWELAGFLKSFGAPMLTADNTRVAMNTPEGEKALQLMAELGTTSGVVPTWSELDNPIVGFYQGKVGMLIDGSWAITRYNLNSQVPFDTAFVPSGPAGKYVSASGSQWSIYSGTKRRDEAWRLLKFLTGTQGIELFVSRHVKSLPGRASAVPLWVKAAQALGTPVHVAIFPETIDKYGADVPATPAWNKLAEIINNNVTQLMEGKVSPKAALIQIEREGNAALAAIK
jgi:multiple sugar transport system substrate-binding protein